MIKLENVSLQRGTKFLLEEASLTIHPGQKWGIIGSNGCGKSTLFQMLTGKLAEDAGSLSIPSDWRIAHMAQEVSAVKRCAEDYVLDGDKILRRIENDIANAQVKDDGEALAKGFAELEQVDGYTAQARAQRLLAGLGFKPADGKRDVSDFSGGWRIRLNLAQALMCPSDLLLLDEPTNHLDLDATLWLENWLKQYSGTLIIISHDRDFLDNVIGNIVSFENCKLVSYTGGYSDYEIQRAERLAQQAIAFSKQQERIAEIEQFVNRFRAKATKARQAQSRLKELDRMEKIAPAHVDSPFDFRFPKPEKLPQVLITLSEAAIGYSADAPIADKIEFGVLGSSRIGLLGHNGAGKTTLIKTLSNMIPLVGGQRSEGQHLRIGYFAQHQLESLDTKGTPLLHLRRLTPKETEQKMRDFLGSFGFHGDKALDKVGNFSGGEKARLALAIIAWQKPNLLLLDEPTNHLDLEMRHALTVALQAFEGAVIIVSHDRHLLRSTVEEFVLVDNGKVAEFDGDLEDYRNWLSNENKESKEAEAEASNKNEPNKADKKQLRQNAAALRDKLKPYTNAIKKLEKQMETLQEKLAKLEEELADPEIYQTGGDKLKTLLKQQGELRSQLAETEEEWFIKSDELEALNAEVQ
ncbi:ATP-binding cassette domain-containing protein [Saccharophagus degradans]|uniref:ATP-binding cassette domain-containing protein n=1 Tax=Saccharophagus degradans TaxID=86304 RepID=UPI001C085547|nr:ATP-binding cassette domain-containing protein [Saccharophagus degradans]MBU2984035.1 ATP-binding cassette domain-containing protein [Saccharophagus degradans]